LRLCEENFLGLLAMTYLVASAQRGNLQNVRESSPEIWRQVRRYNQPVQLALAAADEVIQFADDPSTAGMATGTLGNLRMNPTQTLHAVDNLALSAFAISHGNHSYCLGLGGAAGQAWCGLEAVQERLAAGIEEEALLMAGDQDAAEDGAPGLGVALLFSIRAKAYQPLGRVVRLLSISRNRERTPDVVSHAANGLAAFLSAIIEQKQGPMSYVVPPEHTDGLSGVTVSLEIL
jgi:hypothetical protein